MINNSIYLFLLLAVNLITAQNNFKKDLGSFKILKIYNGIDVELIKSKKNFVEVSGEKSDKIRFKSDNHKLKILLSFPQTIAEGKVKVILYYNSNIDIIDVNEGSTLTSKILKQQNVEIKAQEGSFINMVIDADHLRVKSTTGSVVKLSGYTSNQIVTVDLGANYHGYNLKVNNMNFIRAGSGAKAEVNSGKILDAKVSFGGSIFYRGKPAVLKVKKVIGGVIESRI